MCFNNFNNPWGQVSTWPQTTTISFLETMVTTQPTANITVNKARKKVFVDGGDKVYLNSGDEFEIELFNPTQNNVAAEIFINGNAISKSMLVIAPGTRAYIERYIDNPARFKFDTYEVEAGDAQVEAAIAKNGIVTVKFYAEDVQPVMRMTTSSFGTSRGLGNSVFNSQSYGAVASSYTSSVAGSASMDSLRSFSDTKSAPTMQETGRVAEGSRSSQQFTTCNMRFKQYASHTVTVKIEPQSKMPITVADIKVYCTECGRKKKDSERFCPNDGAKYN